MSLTGRTLDKRMKDVLTFNIKRKSMHSFELNLNFLIKLNLRNTVIKNLFEMLLKIFISDRILKLS